jgi:hypothetical protein
MYAVLVSVSKPPGLPTSNDTVYVHVSPGVPLHVYVRRCGPWLNEFPFPNVHTQLVGEPVDVSVNVTSSGE